MSPAEQRKAQREAAEVLAKADARKRGIAAEAYNASRRDQRSDSPRRGGRLDLDVAQIVRLYVDQRLTLKQVAAEMGVSVKVVQTRLKEAGVERRNINAERRKITREQLAAAVEAGLTPTQIANEHGMSPRHVNDLVRELRRETGQPIRTRSHRVDPAPVLEAAERGLSVTAIAQTLGLSEVTVRRKLRDAGVKARDGRKSA
jgi:AraC-like DNA-binding protein